MTVAVVSELWWEVFLCVCVCVVCVCARWKLVGVHIKCVRVTFKSSSRWICVFLDGVECGPLAAVSLGTSTKFSVCCLLPVSEFGKEGSIGKCPSFWDCSRVKQVSPQPAFELFFHAARVSLRKLRYATGR